jgi:penicillin-binding protein 1C
VLSDSLPWIYQKVLDEPGQLPGEASASVPISAGPVYLTWEALLSLERPDEESGWDSFSSSRKIAWKTGTSFGFRDAWAIGSTPDYVVAVWAGNASGEGRPGLTGVTSAAPIMFEIFNMLPGNSWFPVPYDDLDKTPVCKLSGHFPSSFCPQTDTVYIPWNRPGHTDPCPYHQQIFHEKSTGLRVSRDCLPDAEMASDTFFVLPPAQAWYFKRRNAWYQNPPEWSTRCLQTNTSNPMQLITQLPPKGIYVPLDLNGKPSSLVLEAAHNQPKATIYWYMGEQFLGTTRDIHNLTFNPPPGNHTLILMDEEGNLLERDLRIRSR